MALNPKLYTAISLNEYFVDKNTGEPLASGTIEFFKDTDRNTNKLVYALSGTEPNYTYSSLGSTLTLNDSGQVVDGSNNPIAVYYYPYVGTPSDDPSDPNLELYYVVCLDKDGGNQWTKEAVPNLTADSDAIEELESAENQLSNPQFSKTWLNDTETITYTLSGAVNEELAFAPNWVFIASGTGNITVTRIAKAGNDNIITTPPYVLRIACDPGITKCWLRQRFDENSGLWTTVGANTRYLVGSVVAQGVSSGVSFTMYYAESSGNAPEALVSDTAATGGYVNYISNNPVAITQSIDTNTGISGYVDIYLALDSPGSSTVEFTSIQVIPTTTAVDVNKVVYNRRSSNREQAMMGDFFIPALSNKTTKNVLQGWDFKVNPAQWGETGTLLSTPAAGSYIWDQTIAIDTNATVTYARNADTDGLQFTTVGSSNAISMVQFLEGSDVKALLGNRLSVNVNAFRTSAGGAVTMRVYLYRGTNAAAFPSLAANEFIATVSTAGVATSPFTGWTEISRNGLDTATATVTSIANFANLADASINYGFNNWEITNDSEIDNTEKFAILITFAYASASTVLTVNSVNLSLGDIPCQPNPTSFNESYLACERYYRKSFLPGTPPATQASSGGGGAPVSGEQIMGSQGSGAVANTFPYIRFINPMRSNPTVTLYNPVNNNAEAYNFTKAADVQNTTIQSARSVGFYVTYLGQAGDVNGDTVGVHWTADSRIGT